MLCIKGCLMVTKVLVTGYILWLEIICVHLFEGHLTKVMLIVSSCTCTCIEKANINGTESATVSRE